MQVSGVSRQDVLDVVAKLNASGYAENIVVQRLDALNKKGTRHALKLGTADSKAHGSRTASSGRHGRYLCWHGFRDVVRGIMAVNPDATVRTMTAIYRGAADFERTYSDTAETNVGSMIRPNYMPELCVGTCVGDWE